MTDGVENTGRQLPSSVKRFLTVTDVDGTPLQRTTAPPPPSALLTRLQAFLPRMAAANAQLASTQDPAAAASCDLIEPLDPPALKQAAITVSESDKLTLSEKKTQKKGNKSDDNHIITSVDMVNESNDNDDDDDDSDDDESDSNSEDDSSNDDDDNSNSSEDGKMADGGGVLPDQAVEMVLLVDNSLGQLVPNEEPPAAEKQSRPLIVELPPGDLVDDEPS